jgi:hypothetical protein
MSLTGARNGPGISCWRARRLASMTTNDDVYWTSVVNWLRVGEMRRVGTPFAIAQLLICAMQAGCSAWIASCLDTWHSWRAHRMTPALVGAKSP